MGADRGQTLVLTALAMPVVMGFSGLVLDLGMTTIRYRDARNAADAAALAGAYQLQTGGTLTTATSTAQQVARQDGFDNITVTYTDSAGNSTTTPSQVAHVTAQVIDRVPTTFLKVLGINSTGVGSAAIATISSGSGSCGLCVLNSSGRGIDVSGSEAIKVTNGNINVNSTAPTAITANGSGGFTANAINVVGGYVSVGFSFNPAPATGSPPVADPFAALPVPSLTGVPQTFIMTASSQTINPGIYSDIEMANGGTLTLSPGTYVLTGPINISSGTIVGSGVLIYFACWNYPTPCPDTGATWGGLHISGSSSYQLTGPTSGPYQGLSIFYDSHNTATLDLNGTGSNSCGDIYAAMAQLNMAGSTAINSFNSQIVVGMIAFSGSGQINISFKTSSGGPAGPPVLTQ